MSRISRLVGLTLVVATPLNVVGAQLPAGTTRHSAGVLAARVDWIDAVGGADGSTIATFHVDDGGDVTGFAAGSNGVDRQLEKIR